MRTLRLGLIVAVALLMACPVLAGEGKRGDRKKGGEKKPAANPVAERIEGMLEGVTLTEEQKGKITALAKELGSKLAEARKKVDAVFTEEQKKARAEAMRAAKAAGKTGKEAKEAITAAMNLTDAQKARLAEAQEALGTLEKGLRDKVLSLLTEEQKAQLKKPEKPKKRQK